MEALLLEGGADMSIERLQQIFPFPLDDFQKKSVDAILLVRCAVCRTTATLCVD